MMVGFIEENIPEVRLARRMRLRRRMMRRRMHDDGEDSDLGDLIPHRDPRVTFRRRSYEFGILRSFPGSYSFA